MYREVNLKQQLNNLFWNFEQNQFQYHGIYPYQTELVFAFADYIEKISDNELQEIIPDISPQRIKKIVSQGTEKWLKKHAKTMCLL